MYCLLEYNHNDFPGYQQLAERHNNAFEGQKLPGFLGEVPKRTTQKVSGMIDRSWKRMPPGQSGGTPQMKHERAQRNIFEEQRVEQERQNRAFSESVGSTVQDLEAVERGDRGCGEREAESEGSEMISTDDLSSGSDNTPTMKRRRLD